MTRMLMLAACPFFLCPLVPAASAQDTSGVRGPLVHMFSTHDGFRLKAYVFQPTHSVAGRAAIVLFHGGGWTIGSPDWAFGRARHFAGKGMVAISAQYRLSDRKTITPLEAMADARAAIRWVRGDAGKLGIDPKRVVAYGWSSGGHLAVSAAIFADTVGKQNSFPDALILISPALQVEKDTWAHQLLGGRVNISEISPVFHVRAGLPPTLFSREATTLLLRLKAPGCFPTA